MIRAFIEATLLMLIVASITLAITHDREPMTIYLPADQWSCTDMEPDGCAEYRRGHEHETARAAEKR